MAHFNLSPSVHVTEKDETLFVEQLGNYIGGMPGTFNWGPVEKPILITGGAKDLVNRFWKPTNDNYLSFCVAEDFLGYTNKLWIYRMTGSAARNAVPEGQDPVLVKNEDQQESQVLTGVDFLAKYPGSIGNGLIVDICDSENFSTWEFRKSFDFTPEIGEYAMVVLDGSGKWTGTGATRQQERMVISGKAVGGVQQIQTLSVTGTAEGGTKQKEILTVIGTATTDSTITVDGNDVDILANDSPNTIATKIADELALNTTKYDSAVAVANKVNVTFKVPLLTTKIADVNDVTSGVSVTSAISVPGNDRFFITLYGKNVYVNNLDTAAEVATAIKEMLDLNTEFKDISMPTATSIKHTYLVYGPQGTIGSQTLGGVTLATTVNTTGDANIALTVLGVTVPVLNGDNAQAVAAKVSTALIADSGISALYTNIYADRSSVVYTNISTGFKVQNLAPVKQNGVEFDIDVMVIGRSGTILEKYELMTNTEGAKFFDGTSKYFVDAVKNKSNYITVGDETIQLTNRKIVLQGGVDDNVDVNKTAGFQEFSNAEKYNINYLIAGAVPSREQKAVFNAVEARRDCLGFVSPQFSDVVDNKGNEVEDILEWRTVELNRDSTYVVSDDNWGYYYDKHNDKYRWIPACGGTAGVKARSDYNFEAWTSPAIFENSEYKNYAKMAWSSSKEQRDELYPLGINSIVTFPGEGIRLFGDRTTISRPSAFRGIGVRSAFIVAEKSIADFSKYYLFKNNTPYTRNQFLNAVRPFLRNMKNREAFEDFKVICDESNNDGQARQNNEMNAKFLLKPVYSINFIYLDFVAVGATVSFEEIEVAQN